MSDEKTWPLMAVIVGCVAIVAIFGMVGITGNMILDAGRQGESWDAVTIIDGAQNQYGEDYLSHQVMLQSECRNMCLIVNQNQIGKADDIDVILTLDSALPEGYGLNQGKTDCFNLCMLRDPVMAQFWEKHMVATKLSAGGSGVCVQTALGELKDCQLGTWCPTTGECIYVLGQTCPACSDATNEQTCESYNGCDWEDYDNSGGFYPPDAVEL